MTLAVRVVAADTGAPIEGATVTLGGWLGRDAVTDEAGVAELAGVGTTFDVTVEGDGYAPVSVEYLLSADPGGRVERTIRLSGGAEVRGTVLDPRGQPVAGAHVTTSRGDGPPSASTLTDERGAWRFPVVAAGNHVFAAVVDGHPPAQASLHVDGTRPTEGVVLQLELGAQVTGVVVDEAGAPVPNARVDVVVDGRPFVRWCGADGRFVVTGLRRGAYSLVASDGDRASAPVRVDVSTSDAADLTVTIADTTISGIVVDVTGQPVARAEVSAFPEGEYYGHGLGGDTITDSSGRFTVGPLVAGSYLVGARWSDTPRDNRYLLPDMETVRTGTRDLRIVLPAAGAIRGRVTLGGQPLTRYGVSIAGSFPPHVVASAEGVFERRGLPPGKTGVIIAAEGFATRSLRRVVVEAGEVTDLGTIEVDLGREVRGKVVDADGAAVAGATVAIGSYFHPLEDDPYVAAILRQRRAETDADGVFVIRGVSRSRRLMLKIIADHPTHGRTHELPLPDGDAEVVLTLRGVGSIAGTVSGAPAGETMAVTATSDGAPVGTVHTIGGARFVLERVPPGAVSVRADSGTDPASRAVVVTVEAGKVAEVSIPFPRGEVTLEVRTGDCSFVALTEPGGSWRDAVVMVPCDKTDHVTELTELEPGDYQVCIGATCKPLTITASPEVQPLDARGWK
jgi:uncharacterized GH25 family protein